MNPSSFEVSAWQGGGPKPPGYGLRVGKPNREQYLRRPMPCVVLELAGWPRRVRVEVSHSFWAKCPEFVHDDIGAWLKTQDLLPWPKSKPPRFQMTEFFAEDLPGIRAFQVSKATTVNGVKLTPQEGASGK